MKSHSPQKDNKLMVRFSIGYTALYVCIMVLIAGGLAAWYSNSDANLRAVITYGSSLFGAMVALLTLLYTAQTLKGTSDDRKRSAALGFVERWNNPAYKRIKDEWRAINSQIEGKNLEEKKKTLSEPKARGTVTEVLNFYEEMGVAVNTSAADEEVLRDFFFSIATKYWEIYEDWVREERKNTQWRRGYISFEKMINKWNGDQPP